jgi:hypothetical protein
MTSILQPICCALMDVDRRAPSQGPGAGDLPRGLCDPAFASILDHAVATVPSSALGGYASCPRWNFVRSSMAATGHPRCLDAGACARSAPERELR